MLVTREKARGKSAKANSYIAEEETKKKEGMDGEQAGGKRIRTCISVKLDR